MLRYYICPVIGDGSMDNPYRAKIADYAVSHTDVISDDPVAVPYALVLVNAKDHRELLRDPDIDALPEFPLDGKVNAMQTQARNRMQAALDKRGITVNTGSADGFRDVLRGIGRNIDTNFHENNFSVSE